MFCAISGVSPTVPVVSKVSGLIYEKELILKYLRENDGKDPVTGEALTEADLLEIKTSPSAPAAPPRQPTLTSIPALLHALQNEWDSSMLEVHELRKVAASLRQDLSHALYREDAAIRVLARVMRERDEAREALGSVSTTLGISAANGSAAGGDVEMEVDQAPAQSGLSGSVLQRVKDTAESLSAVRKKRKVAGDDIPDVKAFAQTSTVPSLHSTKPPGISALDVTKGGQLWLTGGQDKNLLVYDAASGKTLATCKGHGKKITAVAFVDPVEAGSEALPQLLVSASQDKTIRLWQPADAKSRSKQAYVAGATISAHTDEVTSLSVHPSRSIFASTSLDGTWALHDLEDPANPKTVATGPLGNDAGGKSIAFHPDGIIFTVGTSIGTVLAFDTTTLALAHTFEGGASGPVDSLAFSENGYLFASASAEPGATVDIWNLRKLAKVTSIPAAAAESAVHALAWDPSATFLVAAGTSLRAWQNKAFDAPALTFEENAQELTSLSWSGKTLFTAGLDRTVRVLGVAE